MSNKVRENLNSTLEMPQKTVKDLNVEIKRLLKE